MDPAMDPEEIAALAAMRAAFADDDAPVQAAFKPIAPRKVSAADAVEDDDDELDDVPKKPAKGKGKAAKKVSEDVLPSAIDDMDDILGEMSALLDPSKRKKASAVAVRAVAGDDFRERTSAPADRDWIQGEVDRLVGEVQRLARGPFSERLLRSLWTLDVEDQQDVLMGAMGTDLLEAAQGTKATKLWELIEDEVKGRKGLAAPVQPKGPPPARLLGKAGAPAIAKAPATKASVAKARPVIAKAPAKGKGKRPAARSRSRSRSLSV